MAAASLLPLLAVGCTTPTPPQPSPPTISSFSVAPDTIVEGGTAILAWTVTNADTVAIVVGDVEIQESSESTGTFDVAPLVTTQYKLIARRGTRSTEATVTLTVTPAPVAPQVDEFEADPANLPVGGGTSRLSWVVSDATSVVVASSGGTIFYDGAEVEHAIDVTLTETTTYTLTATGENGLKTERDLTVTVASPAPTIDTFVASPATLPAGGGTTELTWSVTGATSVELSPVGGAPLYSGTDLSHSITIPVTETTTYRLTATSPDDSTTAERTVTVSPPPPPPSITTFTATPSSLPYTGGTVSVSWVVTGADGVVVEVVGGPTLYDGSELTNSIDHPVAANTTFSLTATNSSGPVSGTATVTVAAPPVAAIQGLSAVVVPGSQLQIEWLATDALSADVYAVASDDTTVLLDDDATSPLIVPIPASTRQTIRVVAHGPGGDDSTEVVPDNVVVSTADYDVYDLLGYTPETPIPGTLRFVLANAAPGSVVGFASDITEIALEGVDLESTPSGIVDAHLILRQDVTVSGPPARVTLRGSYNMDIPGIVDPFTYESRLVWIGSGRDVVFENLNLLEGTFIYRGAGVFNAGKLTIRNSDVANGRAWEGGGGIWNAATGDLRLEGVSLSGNEAAVLDSENGNPLIIRDQVMAGQTFNLQGYGGAVFNDGGTVYMEDTTISSNRSRFSGGAIYSQGGTLEIVDSTITGNSSDFGHYTPGGNQPGFGGGLVLTGNAILTASNVTLSNNFALREGGALYLDTGSALTFTSLTISNNSSDYGGGISQRYTRAVGELDRTGIVFSGNSATTAGPDYYGVCTDCAPYTSTARPDALGVPAPGLYTPSPDVFWRFR